MAGNTVLLDSRGIDPVLEKIRSILKEHGQLNTDLDALALDADLDSAGMTGHACVEVMHALEEEFDIEFPDYLLKRSIFDSIASISAAVGTLTGHTDNGMSAEQGALVGLDGGAPFLTRATHAT